MAVKIASWNVNSIKMRVDAVTNWLREAQPDVLCLQELKCEDSAFPRAALRILAIISQFSARKRTMVSR